jgi:hypothetical protein
VHQAGIGKTNSGKMQLQKALTEINWLKKKH